MSECDEEDALSCEVLERPSYTRRLARYTNMLRRETILEV